MNHVGNGECFERDKVVGVERSGHDGGRRQEVGRSAKGKRKSPTAKTMRLCVCVILIKKRVEKVEVVFSQPRIWLLFSLKP